MSAGPPGPNGTTILTGLAGQLCAAADVATAASAASMRPSLVAQNIFSSRCFACHAMAARLRPTDMLKVQTTKTGALSGGNPRRQPRRVDDGLAGADDPVGVLRLAASDRGRHEAD